VQINSFNIFHFSQQISSSCQTSQQNLPPPCCCQHIDYDDEVDDENNKNYDDDGITDDYDDVEGRYSPKKVTFSDYDQVKLMSMESLLSAATSDASTMEDPAINIAVTQIAGAPRKGGPTVVLQDPTIYNNDQTSNQVPKRNQKAPKKSRLV
jgi:hypothetical protein